MRLTKDIQTLLDLYQKPTNSSKDRQHYAEKIIAIILEQIEEKNKI
jgi:hypothetical protein